MDTLLKFSLHVSRNDIEIRVQKDNHECLYFTSLIRYFQQIQILTRLVKPLKSQTILLNFLYTFKLQT